MQVLVVDDDRGIRDLVRTILSDDGFNVVVAENGESAIELARTTRLDLVFCDVMMGKMSGFDVLRAFKDGVQPDSDIVLMTGHASLESALEAVRAGARDYILKPFSVDDLLALAHSTAERRRLVAAPVSTEPDSEFADLIGRSRPMIEVFKTIGRVAATELPVFICGESGTGKEVVARTIHSKSARAHRPFVSINCGALTETLLDSELFGSMKGSFTGALTDRRGLFEEAHGGTILLDEITETSAAFQVKLLRVLQEGEIRRVGSTAVSRVDVRVLATTNRDVNAAVAAGLFREDLLYRLNIITITLPPLRERAGDVDLMVNGFLKRFRPPGARPVRITTDALERLRAYQWPGNIRELRNTIQRLVALNSHGVVSAGDLPPQIRESRRNTDDVPSGHDADRPSGAAPARSGQREWLSLGEMEARYVRRALCHTGGNVKRAADILKVDRKTLTRMIERHTIDIVGLRREVKGLDPEE